MGCACVRYYGAGLSPHAEHGQMVSGEIKRLETTFGSERLLKSLIHIAKVK
jgi:hypothetical protein